MNWKIILSEIFDSGKTQLEVAKLCQCSQMAICKLYQEETKSPRYELGEKILKLHKKVLRANKRKEKVNK